MDQFRPLKIVALSALLSLTLGMPSSASTSSGASGELKQREAGVASDPVVLKLGNRYRLKQAIDPDNGGTLDAGEVVFFFILLESRDPATTALGFRVEDGQPAGLRVIRLPVTGLDSRLGELFEDLTCMYGCTPVERKSLTQITADIDNDRLDSATEQLQLLRTANPKDPEILVQLARVEIRQGANGPAVIGMPSDNPDKGSLFRAERLLEEAAKLDPKHANTWILHGYLAYLQRNFARSRDLLIRAEQIGSDNPWLRVNMGDTLWAMAITQQDVELMQQAERQYLLALEMPPINHAQANAHRSLAQIYLRTGNIAGVRKHSRDAVESSVGLDRAYALHHEALMLFDAHDIDGALRSAREAVEVRSFPLGREFLSAVLAVKAGQLYKQGRSREARPLATEAAAIDPDFSVFFDSEPYTVEFIPIIYALREYGGMRDFSGPKGGRILVGTAMFGHADDVSALLDWGADPNAPNAQFGTALHAAVLGGNIKVVELLLSRGANPLVKDPDGNTPYALTWNASAPNQATTRKLLISSAGKAAMGSSDNPYFQASAWYVVRKPIGEALKWGRRFSVGERLQYRSLCVSPNRELMCFRFKDHKLSESDMLVRIVDEHLLETSLTAL